VYRYSVPYLVLDDKHTDFFKLRTEFLNIVVPQNKVPVSCTKTANYNSSLINISFTVCQKKRRAFFLCVSGYFVIVVLTTIKKEKERILPQHVLSLTRECRKQ